MLQNDERIIMPKFKSIAAMVPEIQAFGNENPGIARGDPIS